MSITSRMAEPVRAPIRQFVNHYSTFFEDLIHAVKSELVGNIDHLNKRVDDVERSLSTSHAAIADQMSIQTATLRSLSTEVERLQTIVDQLLPSIQPAGKQVLDLAEEDAAPHTAAGPAKSKPRQTVAQSAPK